MRVYDYQYNAFKVIDMPKDGKKFLIGLGVKEKLLEKLNENIVNHLVSFAMDHATMQDIAKKITQLAFMELNGKKNAVTLASIGIATIDQLKALNDEQISEILVIYEMNKDVKIAIKNVKKALVSQQQEKLYFESGGLKGEYFLDSDVSFDDDASDQL